MTPQQTFDFVVNHLRTMPSRCAVTLGTSIICVYHDETTGNRCAVGSLFPVIAAGNAPLLKKLDGQSCKAMSIAKYFAGEIPEWFSQQVPMLQVLQGAHDTSPNWTDDKFNSRGERELLEIAKEYKLKYQPPEDMQ